MTSNEASIQYANALCQLAIETKVEESISKDTKELLSVIQEDHDFVKFFNSKSVSGDDKKNVVKKVFDKKLNDYLVNLLLYLVDNSDEKLLSDILVKFNEILDQTSGVVKVKIFTPFELNKEDIKKILLKVESKTNKKAQEDIIIDPKLIGGIKVEYDDVVYNNSIRNKIDLIKNNLRKK